MPKSKFDKEQNKVFKTINEFDKCFEKNSDKKMPLRIENQK
jgi:hypothetical protein